MKKVGKKTKFRVTFLFIALIITSVVFISTAFSYISQINRVRKNIDELKMTYNDKLEEEDNLNDEINKLQDPEYMARYAREKYLYSKKDEIIIKIEE